MSALKTLYVMAFTPEKMEDTMLVAVSRMAADRLATRDAAFAQRMSQLTQESRMTFSNQLHSPVMHTPQTMQSTLAGWLANEKSSFNPRLGDNFFPHGMRDPKGRENYFLFYFDFQS